MRIDIAALALVGFTRATHHFDDSCKQSLLERITSFADNLQDLPNSNEKQELLRLQSLTSQIAVPYINQTSAADCQLLLNKLNVSNRKRREIHTDGSIFQSIINFKDINTYGCWCKIANPGKGWGSSMDDIDAACKTFQLCRKCIDLESNGDTCDALTQNYTIVSNYFSGHNIASECSAANPGSTCAQRVCSCEVQFVSQLLSLFFRLQDSYDSSYHHDNGFDPDASCQVWVTGQKDWQCCGTFPEIMPYNTYDKFCCNSRMPYDPDYQNCCTDGSVNHYSSSCSSRRRRSHDGANVFFEYVRTTHFFEEA